MIRRALHEPPTAKGEADALERWCGVFWARHRRQGDRPDTGHLLAIDRSTKAIAQAPPAQPTPSRPAAWTSPRVRKPPYDLGFAIRVGALDGRHPDAGRRAFERIAAVTTLDARLSIDGGDPLGGFAIPRR